MTTTTTTTEKCHKLCCHKRRMKKGGGRYCVEHKGCALADAFGAALREKLTALPGAEPVASYLDDADDHGAHGWRLALPTRAGRLVVSFHDGDYALFTIFDEEKRAVALLGRHEVNPHSGKWNHHITDGHPVDTAVLYVMNQLQRVL